MSDVWAGPGYWIASDGKWYPPELHSDWVPPAPEEVVAESSTPIPVTEPSTNGHFAPPAAVPPASAAYPGLLDLGSVVAGAASRSRRRPWVIAGTALTAVIVVVAVLVAVTGQSTKWDPRVVGIVHFVEQHRGLTFKQPVKVEFLDNAQFDQEVAVPQPTSQSDKADLRHALGELRALGLVHGSVNLAQSENKLTQADVVGLYVNEKKTVFVRGTKLTPYVRVTLAHELTHALQDQYFDLTSLQSHVKHGDEDALTALVEGDAVRTQNLYEQSLSPADEKAYQKVQAGFEKGSGKTSQVPEILSDMLSFPYAFGPTFVDSLVTQGGTTALDAAFKKPPEAEAQIVDPVLYPIGWKPTPVAVPKLPAGDKRVDKPSSFGQVSLFEVLGSRLGYDKAWAAVQGWQGDNSVPYTDHGHTCIAADIVMKDATSATALDTAALEWAQSIPGATVTQTGRTVDLRSCDPGPKAPAAPVISPSAFDVLSARALIIDAFMTRDNIDYTVGKCVADRVLVGVGPSNYGELTASKLTAAQQAQFQQLVVTSAESCQAQGAAG